jgi:hypothetical protein
MEVPSVGGREENKTKRNGWEIVFLSSLHEIGGWKGMQLLWQPK